MIINAKIDQSEETEWVVGAISREFQRSPRQFFNAWNLPTRSARMLTSLLRKLEILFKSISVSWYNGLFNFKYCKNLVLQIQNKHGLYIVTFLWVLLLWYHCYLLDVVVYYKHQLYLLVCYIMLLSTLETDFLAQYWSFWTEVALLQVLFQVFEYL